MTNGEKMQEVFPEGKTRRCINGVVFESDGWCRAYDSDWWNAEYKELTTKNCESCRYYGSHHEVCKYCYECSLWTQGEPTTKNNLAVEEHKGEVMDFPNTFDEFADDYGFKDTKEVYTNGSELIQVYRVKQWLEHINEKTTMIDKSNFSQEQYKADLQSAYDCGYNQTCKSKITMPYATPDNCGNYIEQTAMSDLGVDCISRESILKLIYDYKENHSNDREHYPINYGTLLDMIRWVCKLPPVTPQPRKGRWIFDGDCLICSKCKKAYSFSGSNFCPNCGADMRESEVKE